jgi:hypothetical protein
MDNYYNLLLTNNPDKYYEYYWCSFKGSIYEELSIYIKNEIDIYSNRMNNLQKQQKYDDILLCMSDFFVNNINQIIAEIYLSNQFKLNLLKTNIHRFIKLQPPFTIKSIEYDILVIITNIINKSNSDKLNLINNYINQYFITCIKINKYITGCLTYIHYKELLEILYDIVNMCIEYNIISLIDVCSDYIDITLFFKENINKKKFKYNKGNKLMKLIEQKFVDELLHN